MRLVAPPVQWPSTVINNWCWPLNPLGVLANNSWCWSLHDQHHVGISGMVNFHVCIIYCSLWPVALCMYTVVLSAGMVVAHLHDPVVLLVPSETWWALICSVRNMSESRTVFLRKLVLPCRLHVPVYSLSLWLKYYAFWFSVVWVTPFVLLFGSNILLSHIRFCLAFSRFGIFVLCFHSCVWLDGEGEQFCWCICCRYHTRMRLNVSQNMGWPD